MRGDFDEDELSECAICGNDHLNLHRASTPQGIQWCCWECVEYWNLSETDRIRVELGENRRQEP